MVRIGLLAAVVILIAFVGFGCQKDSVAPTSPMVNRVPVASKATINGMSVDSALFFVYASDSTGQTVRAHQITSDWAEMTVTYANFGEAFDPAIEGSFVQNVFGWHSINVSALVDSWITGTNPNFGILLDQPLGSFPRGVFNSREAADNHPYIELFLSNGTGSQQQILTDIGDSHITELYPDVNAGAEVILVTGWVDATPLRKQSLVKFELPPVDQPAAIGDFVWLDTNMNGIQDVGELGISGVTVQLYTCAGVLVGTTTTDANGYYLFSNLTPGSYYVQFVAPNGYVYSPQDQGLDGSKDSDANITTGKTICVTLVGGQTDLTWDAGLYIPRPLGCTRTIGYYKTHAGFGVQADIVTPLLPVWLGTSGGAKSFNVTTAKIAYDILSQNVYGTSSNGITKLYAQLLGAKLNLVRGADGSTITSVISAADAFLATHSWTDWTGLSAAQKSIVLGWQTTLDNYNNGLVGPPHCSD